MKPLLFKETNNARTPAQDAYPYKGKAFYCSVCDTGLKYFNPLPLHYFEQLDKHQYIHPIFTAETINIFQYTCPACGASDRDRLYALYLKRQFEKLSPYKEYSFIDFAPAMSLANFIKKMPCLKYRSADLYMDGVDDKVDITDLSVYRDDSVDFLLCSHVLEHIEEDRKAMRELYRILKPGGWGIIMVPVLLSLKEIYENYSITSEADRWKHFGQNDHVRIYSKSGFIERLEEAGFFVRQYDKHSFGEEVFTRHGIHSRSVLYIAEKQ